MSSIERGREIFSKVKEAAVKFHEDEKGMLILVRKVEQGIWIEGDIWIRVLSVDRGRVKLGITAPSEVKVMKQELFEASKVDKLNDQQGNPDTNK